MISFKTIFFITFKQQRRADAASNPQLTQILFVVSNPGRKPLIPNSLRVNKDQNQLEREMAILEKNAETIEALISHFTPIYSGKIQSREIFEALFLLLSEKYNFERPGDIWNVEIEYTEVLMLLENFDFSTLTNVIEVSNEIFPEGILMEFKVRIKSKGLIWLIHKNDSDHFPSNPHAHQIDNNIKLDLSNGNCFRIKKYIHTIKKKDLLLIREAAAKVFKGELPPLKI